MVSRRYLLVALCLAFVPGVAAASYSDFRTLYDWGEFVPYTQGPQVLGESDVPPPVGTKVSGYVVQLGNEIFLAESGKDLRRIDLPADVDLSLIKGKYIAGEVSAAGGGVLTLSVAVPAPAPTASGDATTTASKPENTSAIDLGKPGVTPDNRFLSFFDRLGENINRTFIFDPSKLAKHDTDVARERLSEMQQLVKENNLDAASRAAQEYTASLATAEKTINGLDGSKKQEFDDFNKEIASHAALISGDVIGSASKEFRKQLEPLAESTSKALASVADKRGAPALTPEMIDRIQAAASLGTMSKEAAASIFQSKNRTEALGVIEQQVQNGSLAGPDADYLKFDEVRSRYKDSFEKVHELNKLEFIQKANEDRKQFEKDPALKQQVEEFGKNFTEGQQPPEQLRKFWANSVQGEAAQMTFRPDKLNPDQLNNPETRKLYENVRQQLQPTQGDVENVARTQSDSPRFIPQFQHVLRLAEDGVRKDDPSQGQQQGFGGCTSADECITKAKEFQQKYATPEDRRAAFGQEFRQLDQQRPPQGDFPNVPAAEKHELQPKPQGLQNQPQQQNQEQRPVNQPSFWNAPNPSPKDISSRPNDQQNARPREDIRPSSSGQGANPPPPREERREGNRPLENNSNSGGGGGQPNNPPSGDGNGGGGQPNNPPPQ